MTGVERVVGRLTYPVVCGGALVAAAWGLHRGIPGFVVSSAVTVGVAALVAGLERLAPHRRDWLSSHGDLLTDVFHLAASTFLIWAAGIVSPRHTLGLWPIWLPIPLQLVPALLLRELGAYLCHRALHGIPFLWRFHAIHHSSERLYWLNGARNHPVDVLLMTTATLGPLTLLGAPVAVLVLMNAFVSAHLILQHSNVGLRLGAANLFLNTAEVHRWHHSTDPRESLTNFAHVLLLWDFAFGTWRRRTHRGPEEVGIAAESVPPPDYLGQLLYPLRA